MVGRNDGAKPKEANNTYHIELNKFYNRTKLEIIIKQQSIANKQTDEQP